MWNGTVLDVAVGVMLVFLMLSIAVSLVNERIHSMLDTRATMLDGALRKMLGDEHDSPVFGVQDHALVRAINHTGRRMPSYLPASTFSQALFDTLVPADGDHPLTFKRLREAIQRQPPTSRTALLALTSGADGDLDTARASVEHWYDSAMDRLSGAYKRHVTVWLIVLGFLAAAAVNADAILLVQRLEHESALRARVTAHAEKLDTTKLPQLTDQADMTQLDLVFWDTDRMATSDAEAARYPRAMLQPEMSMTWLRWLLLKIAGCLMTALAVSLGAPFWFDLLGRLVNLRASGARPKPSAPAA